MSHKPANKRRRLKRRRDLRKPNTAAVVPTLKAPTAGLLTLPAGLIGQLARPTNAAFAEALSETQHT